MPRIEAICPAIPEPILIAEVPDITGEHRDHNGDPILVDVDQIEAHNGKQVVKIKSKLIGGTRIVGLTQEGTGNSVNKRKGGDSLKPDLKVTLCDRPIRISYIDKLCVPHTSTFASRGGSYVEIVKRTYYNPRWNRSRAE